MPLDCAPAGVGNLRRPYRANEVYSRCDRERFYGTELWRTTLCRKMQGEGSRPSPQSPKGSSTFLPPDAFLGCSRKAKRIRLNLNDLDIHSREILTRA